MSHTAENPAASSSDASASELLTPFNECAQLVREWDGGRVIQTVEMGGLSRGYERAIQATMVEVLRFLIGSALTVDDLEPETWPATRVQVEAAVFPVVDHLGLSGAQWGAAVNLAGHFFRKGVSACLADPVIADRRIQMSVSDGPEGQDETPEDASGMTPQ